MASEKVGISEEMSIKKTTLNEKGEVAKTTYFFPDKGVSIEASSYEEALKILSSMDKGVNK
jgi:hypothetical protein